MTGGVYVVPALGVQLAGPRPDLGDLNDHPVNGPAAWRATVESMRALRDETPEQRAAVAARAAQFNARVRQDAEDGAMTRIEQHPLGFTKVNLIWLFGYRVRLHLWRQGGSEHPHMHRWPFLSVPLWGRFIDRRWREAPGDGYRRVTAIQPGTDRGREYQPEPGTAGLVLDAVHERRPGRPYLCRLGTIHSFAPAGQGCHVSLVFLGPARSDRSTTWQPASPSAVEAQRQEQAMRAEEYNVEGLTILSAVAACRREAEAMRRDGHLPSAASLDRSAAAVFPLLSYHKLTWTQRALIRVCCAAARNAAGVMPRIPLPSSITRRPQPGGSPCTTCASRAAAANREDTPGPWARWPARGRRPGSRTVSWSATGWGTCR